MGVVVGKASEVQDRADTGAQRASLRDRAEALMGLGLGYEDIAVLLGVRADTVRFWAKQLRNSGELTKIYRGQA
ncbi:MAG: hypothetical protein AAFQ58_19155 [Pseudomonadota bacterium]